MAFSDIPLVKKVPVGTHRITAKSLNHGTISIKVNLMENDVFSHAFVMKKSTDYENLSTSAKASTGKLYLLTEHQNMSVIFDGMRRTLPLELENVSTGNYKAIISDGTQSKSIDIIVKEDQDTIINIDKKP